MKAQSIPLFALILFSIGFAGCKKEKLRVDAPASGVHDRPYFFRATINGVPESIKFNMKTEEFVIAFTEQTIYHDEMKCVGPGTTLSRKTAKIKEPAASFRNICYYEGETPSEKVFYGIFEPMNQPFYQYFNSDSTQNLDNSGVVISWLDENGKIWSSQYGPQTGSVFSIKSGQSIQGPNGEIQFEVNAEFKCNLYDLEGNSISLENGQYFLPYEKLFK